MIRQWGVELHVGTVIHRITVPARSHEEAEAQAIQLLKLRHAQVDSSKITPTLRRPA